MIDGSLADKDVRGGPVGSGPFLHLIDGVRDESVGLSVDRVGSLGVRSLDKAEDLSLALVHPVAQIADLVLALGREVGLALATSSIVTGLPRL